MSQQQEKHSDVLKSSLSQFLNTSTMELHVDPEVRGTVLTLQECILTFELCFSSRTVILADTDLPALKLTK